MISRRPRPAEQPAVEVHFPVTLPTPNGEQVVATWDGEGYACPYCAGWVRHATPEGARIHARTHLATRPPLIFG